MALLGSGPAGSYVITAGADPADIPKSSAAALEIEDSLPKDVMSIQVVSNVAANTYLYLGPDANRKVLMVIPGYESTVITLERQPLALPAGARLSIGAVLDTDITTGSVVINLWV